MEKDKNMKSLEVVAEIRISLSEQDIEDIVVTMLEGGIGYWACLDNTSVDYMIAPDDEPVAVTAARILNSGGELYFQDQEDDNKKLSMTRESLLNGLKLWIQFGYASEYCLCQEIFCDKSNGYKVTAGLKLDLYNFDAEDADQVAQLSMFGEIIYS